MLKTALGLRDEDILSPDVHLNYDVDLLAIELFDQIGHRIRRGIKEIKGALEMASKRQMEFEEELYRKGSEVVSSLKDSEPLIIVSGRAYNLYDEKLNLRLGQNLSKIGIKALPMDFLDVRDTDMLDFSSMYWAYGTQMLKVAKVVKKNPHFFGLHISNFSCGPDSFNEHFYKYIMKEKPCLILELDEHSAVAGVMTRLEAFKNVIKSVRRVEISENQHMRISATGV